MISSLPSPQLPQYDIIDLLGSGGFATVYLIQHIHTHQIFACKCIYKQSLQTIDIKRIHNEIHIHLQLNHSHIVKCFKYWEDHVYFYILLEACNHGNLYKYLKKHGPIKEHQVSNYCIQLLSAIRYLQKNKIIHRDLKLSNILLDDNFNIKLCDFGLAVTLEHPDEEHFTVCGTPNYIAPEVATQQSHGFPADLWSLGCLCYSMLTGEPPFEEGNVKDTLMRIVKGEYRIPSGVRLSNEALGFIQSLLHVDPQARATSADILSHPFLRIHGNNSVSPVHTSFATTALVSYDSTPFRGQPDKVREEGVTEAYATSPAARRYERTPESSFYDHPDKVHQQRHGQIVAVGGRYQSPLRHSYDGIYSSTSPQQISYQQRQPTSYRDTLQSLRHLSVRSRSAAGIDIGVNRSGLLSLSLDGSLCRHSLSTLQTNEGNSLLSFGSSVSNGYPRAPITHAQDQYRIKSTASAPSSGYVGSSVVRLWVSRVRPGAEHVAGLDFQYVSSSGEVLMMKGGDVVFCTYIRDKRGKQRPCRLCVKKTEPLRVRVGRVTKDMCREIQDICRGTGERGFVADTTTDTVGSSTSSVDNVKQSILYDDSMWITSYRVDNLPVAVRRIYNRVHHMIQEARKRLPKLILYITKPTTHTKDEHKTTGDTSVYCKCMLMSNTPLPDFYIRWSDGMRVNYSLATCSVVVSRATNKQQTLNSGSENDQGSNSGSSNVGFRWQRSDFSGDCDWSEHAPNEVKAYLEEAQRAMRRCLSEDSKAQRRRRTEIHTEGQPNKSIGPDIIVESIDNI